MNQKELIKYFNLKSTNAGTCIGGSDWLASGKSTLDSYNPSSNKIIAKVLSTHSSEYAKVVKAAKNAADTWKMMPAPKRGEIVRQIGEELRKHKDALGSLVSLECGKIKAEGDGEVQEMIDIAEFAVGLSRQLYGKTMHSERDQHRMYEQWHPLGVVGVISAFNFPVAVWSWNALVAAVCGNTVVWKPSEKTPLTALAVQEICNVVLKRNNLTGIFNLVNGGKSIGEKMSHDKYLPLISFTGSTAVGKRVHEIVGQRFGKTLLELGGNNAIIVTENANLELAIPAIVFGAVGTAGQRCTTTRRLFLHDTIYVQVMEKLIHAYGQIKIGDPLKESNLMGPLIDEGAVSNYNRAIDMALKEGGKLIYGRETLSKSGNFVKPTIIEAKNHFTSVQKETFAPILYVMPFSSLEEVIKRHNNVPQGLSSSIFTNQMQEAEFFLSHMGSDCGIANVNIGTSGAEIGGAFGGEKETGGGRESGSDAWQTYMRRQTNTINWSSELPLAQGIKFNL